MDSITTFAQFATNVLATVTGEQVQVVDGAVTLPTCILSGTKIKALRAAASEAGLTWTYADERGTEAVVR